MKVISQRGETIFMIQDGTTDEGWVFNAATERLSRKMPIESHAKWGYWVPVANDVNQAAILKKVEKLVESSG